MSIVIIIGLIWGLSSLCKAARQAAVQRRAIQAQHALAIRRAQEAARAAQLREEYRQQQMAARAETARLISAERARMAEEKERQRQEAQAAKEAEQARKAAEKAAKEAVAREQAQADMEHYETIRQGYMDLCDLLQEEMQESTTTAKRRVAIQRQLLTLEEKLYKIDQRRAKAYYIVKGAC